MKTPGIRLSTLTLLILSFSLFSCSSAAENKHDAEIDVEEANEALEIANKEYQQDIANYRAEVKITIAHNDSLISSHKERIKASGLDSNPYYKNEIDNMEDQNKVLEEKMENYKGEGKDNWTVFKEEFEHDVAELAKAITDLTVKNTK